MNETKPLENKQIAPKIHPYCKTSAVAEDEPNFLKSLKPVKNIKNKKKE